MEFSNHIVTPSLRSSGADPAEHLMKLSVIEKSIFDKMNSLEECMNANSVFTGTVGIISTQPSAWES